MTQRPSRSVKSIEPQQSIPSTEGIDSNPVWLTAALVWLVGFCCWFHSFGLVNNSPNLQRWMLWSLIPFDLFDVIDPPLIAGAAPWSWIFLLQRIPFFIVTLMIWIGAWGAGSVALRWIKVELPALDRFFFSICLGLSIVSLSMLLLGVSACLNRWLLSVVLLAGPLVEALYFVRSKQAETAIGRSSGFSRFSKPQLSRLGWIVVMVLAPFVAVQMLGAMSPQTDFDVLEYHLGGPKEWFQQGRISRLPHNVYTNFPFLSEMLILAGMVLYGDWQWGALAGQATIAGFIPLTALGLFAAARRWFSAGTGEFATLIYLTSPWTYRISVIAYAEGSLACYLFASLYALLLFRERFARENNFTGHQWMPFAFMTGAMSGSAMACKYTGLVSVVIPIGLGLVWIVNSDLRLGQFRRIALVGAFFLLGVLACVGPWLVKNTVTTGNPVYPLAVRVFGGVDRDEELDAKWRNGHAYRKYNSWPQRLTDLTVKLADVTANNDWHSPLMFGLAPLSLFWLLRRRGQSSDYQKRALQVAVLGVTWLYILWQFFTWWAFTHHMDRFYVPMFSVVSLLAGVGVCWPTALFNGLGEESRNFTIWRWCAGPIILTSILYNADVMLHLGGFNAGRLDLIAAREIATPGRIRWINEEFESKRLPSNTKVLCVGEAQMFHARYPYVYNTVFDRCLFEELCAEPDSAAHQLRPIDDIRSDFQRLGITHIDVNWSEIRRYRAPGSYGYTNFVQPERFAELQRQGLLGPSLFTTSEENSGSITGQVFPVLY